MSHRIKGRKDHYLPQGYLRGFIDPAQSRASKPLWWFQIAHRNWKKCSTAEVGYVRGFYDHAGKIEPTTETADQAFAELERGFPLVLRELVASQFANWIQHRDFLLRYMQMIRVRSPLYFEHKYEAAKQTEAYVIDEISKDRRQAKVRPTILNDGFIRNRTLTEMKDELKKGADWLNRFDWALRYTDSANDSFLTSEAPFVVTGPLEGQEKQPTWEALEHPDTLFYFPLCWQACIVGSPREFFVATDVAMSDFLRAVRKMYRDKAKSYLLSPVKVNW